MLKTALKIKGRIITKDGYIHSMLYDKAVNLGIIYEITVKNEYGFFDILYSEYGEDGFIDESGNFYNREEALDLAIKIHNFNNEEVDKIVEQCGCRGLESITYEELLFD